MGSITPRLWTRPLRPLTSRTSYGYRVVWFAAYVLHEPLDPWQQWLVIHLGELLDDGRPRFREALIIVARQNGKTHLCKVLALFWLFVERWPMVFGTSTNLEQAKEAWEYACDLATATPALAARIPPRGIRIGNGQQVLSTTDRCRYKIGAADRKGGRGKSIDRAIGDELREQRTWEAYHAASFAMNARPKAQVVYITNQGDARAAVLTSLRASGLDGTDPRLGLFEWSAPPGTHPMDADGWAAANPQLGRRMDYDTLRGAALRVSKPGADPEEVTGFLTEVLCMAVTVLDPAVAPAAWAAAAAPGPLHEATGRLAACLDVAPDGQHASLAVAGLLADGRVRVEIVHIWEGSDALEQARRTLRPMLAVIKPAQFGWFPAGPAAVIDADLRDRSKEGRAAWPPRGMTVQEIKSDAPAVCMGFAEQVGAYRVAHSGQELLDAQIGSAEKLHMPGDRWVFRRGAAAHVDAVYAAAGAVHLVRTGRVRRDVVRGVRYPGKTP
jgi:hypothetical protein